MGASAERIALDIATTADTSGVEAARASVQNLTVSAQRMQELLQQYGGNLQKAAQAAAELARQESNLAETATEAGQAIRNPGGGSAGGTPVEQTYDRMSPRVRTAALAMERLTFAAAGAGGSIQGSVRAAGMLAYSLSELSTSASLAAGAAGIGAVAIALGAVVGLIETHNEKIKAASKVYQDLQYDSQITAAELEGDAEKLKKIRIDKQFIDQKANLEKEFKPGWFMRLMSQGLEWRDGGIHALQVEDPSQKLIATLEANRDKAKAAAATEAARARNLRSLTVFGGELSPDDDPSGPARRYAAQQALITAELREALRTRTMSVQAAEQQAADKRMALARQGIDYRRRLADELEAADAKRFTAHVNAFDQEREAATRDYNNRMEAINRMTLSETQRQAIVEDTNKLYQNQLDLIEQERELLNKQAQAQEQEGSYNPITQLKGRLAAIQLEKEARILSGVEATKAEQIAANEQRQIFEQSVQAAVRSNQSWAKLAKQALLEPVESYLEGLAISEGIVAFKDAASLNFVGAAAHAAVAAAALEGARKVAQMAGLASGGGSSGRGGGGGSNTTFQPRGEGVGGAQTINIYTVDPTSGAAVMQAQWYLNRAGVLKRPIPVPPVRSFGPYPMVTAG